MKAVINQNIQDRIFDVINNILMCILLVAYIYPIVFILSASISDPIEIWAGKVILFPKSITMNGYIRLFKDDTIMRGYLNTILYTLVGTPINLFMTITAAYPLSRKDFMIRKPIMLIYTFTMFFSGGLIPTYLLIKQLNLLNSFWVMIIPTAVSVWNIIVTRTFFQSNIPEELREAASIDSCSNFKFLLKIVLPLSKAIIVVMALFYAVAHWNAFFNALIYLSEKTKYPLQLILRNILIESRIQSEMMEGMNATDAMNTRKILEMSESIKYGAIVVSTLPVLVMYPFVQKYFVKGIMVGSLKG